MTDRTRQLIDQSLEAAVGAGVVPGIVGAASDRVGTFYAHAAGVRRTEPRIAMQTDSVFRIASMTKPITSLAVLMLVEEGKIDLDAPFKAYVPDYRQPELLRFFDAAAKSYATTPAACDVTIRQLLTHTAGYGYWFLDEPLLALKTGEPELLNPPFLMHAPGSRFSYGTSTDVLGQIFEPVTGLPLAEFLQRRIFGPLGMRDTGYALPADATRLVSVSACGDNGFRDWPNEARGNRPHGGGGLYSTAADYLRFLRLLLNGGELDGVRLVGRDFVDAMTRNQLGDLNAARQLTALRARSNDFIFMDGTQEFGFGVLIETLDRPRGRRSGSYGWGGIYNTYFWVDPAADVAAVLFAQTTPFAAPSVHEACVRFEEALYRLHQNRGG